MFLSWNLTAVPCARLPELVRAGTADLTGLAARKGKTRANPEVHLVKIGTTDLETDKLSGPGVPVFV
jgi:hypothetical protein